jgi:hypothetical protein
MLLAVGVVPARAQTLDQSQLTANVASELDADPPGSFAQTFTAGLTGNLVRVDLRIGSPSPGITDPLTVEIRTVDAMGVPTTTVLATETVTPLDVGNGPGVLTTVVFDPPVAVTANTQYAIVLYSAANPDPTVPQAGWVWFGGIPDPYAGGVGYFSNASPPAAAWTPDLFNSQQGLVGVDWVFATYVEEAYQLPNQVTNLAVSGSTLRFRLATAATVRFSLDKRVARNRFRRIGKFTTTARRGRNRVRIPRRLGGRRVGKGVFRLSARASGGGPLSRRLVRIR